MKLKVALAKIREELSKDSDKFAVLRNIETSENLYIGNSYGDEPIVIKLAGLSNEEWEGCDYWFSEKPGYTGEFLKDFKYTIEEVTDHQYGVAILNENPVSRMYKTCTFLKPVCNNLTFVV